MEGSCFLSLPVCACSGFGEIASVHVNIQERIMRAREPTPAGSVQYLLPSSPGCRDVWDEGWSVPMCRGRRQMLGGKHGCSPRRRLRCQMKDLLSWEEQAVPSTCCIQDSPLQRRGAGAVLTLPTWVPPASSRNCSQHLQRRWSLIALISLGVEGEMMFTLIQA